jgi:hypothetical protein
MVRKTQRTSQVGAVLALLPLGLLFLGVPGCAGASAQSQIGTSTNETDTTAGDEAAEDSIRSGSESAGETAADKPAEGDPAEGEAEEEVEEPREAILARTALHESSPPENHLGLAMAVSERASDLSWVLAIENRSPKSIKLAALPTLLSAEITPPEEPAEETDEKLKKPPEPTVCGGKSVPKSLDDDETIELGSGQMIVHAFDPRTLCNGEAPLQQGARVKLTYGFPTQTKKLWKSGKLTTVEIEQTAPFVAEPTKTEGDEIVSLKHLTAEEFTLGDTYPLSGVTALAPTAGSESSEDGANGTGEHTAPSPPPVTVSISPLGTSSAPEKMLVSVRVRNTSGKSMKLFLRRELFTYEVNGPAGAVTCRMQPAARHPDPSAFSSLAPGESRSLQTRLAEACPAGTWETPGTYSVSALFEATASGEEHGLSAFVGREATATPARLVVPGSEKSKPTMIIVSSKPAN